VLNRASRAVAVTVLLAAVACSSSHADSKPVPTATPTSNPTVPTPPSTSPTQTAPAAFRAAPGAVASTGCRAAATPEVSNVHESVSVSGTHRSYLLTTPNPHAGQPAALVVDFHGYGEGDTTESLTTQFGPLGQKDGFISVFPEGRGSPIQWDTSTKPGNRDVAFVTAMLDKIEATQCVDTSRIYATGLSQGAFMTSTMACVMSSRFAAFAPVSGVQLSAPCPDSRPVPILAFHGTGDPILHFNGGVGLAVLADDLHAHAKPLPKLPKARLFGPGYPATVKAWATRDGCAATPTDTKVSPHVIKRAYRCPAGVAVDFDIILGGGHSWPGSAFSAEIPQFVGPTTMEINATTAIWAFFRHFTLHRNSGH
jgi:polyhydroxybutyrate depolymerase